jgi:predicted metal-dependent hydrolase
MKQPLLPFGDRRHHRDRRPRPVAPATAPLDRAGAIPAANPLQPAEPPRSPVAYLMVRSPRARRYVLRLRPDGVVRVTIPARGSRREALEVIERHRPWIERQWRERMAERGPWSDGTRILFRGAEVALTVAEGPGGVHVRFADQDVTPVAGRGVRHAVEGHLRALAERELEPRLRAFAAAHRLEVRGVSVRDQRTRWGSCSRNGSISLNWRLVQMPPAVSDYILLHELMHLRQANHSLRFWREVASVYPDYREAEAWLRRRGRSLW